MFHPAQVITIIGSIIAGCFEEYEFNEGKWFKNGHDITEKVKELGCWECGHFECVCYK